MALHQGDTLRQHTSHPWRGPRSFRTEQPLHVDAQMNSTCCQFRKTVAHKLFSKTATWPRESGSGKKTTEVTLSQYGGPVTRSGNARDVAVRLAARSLCSTLVVVADCRELLFVEFFEIHELLTSSFDL